MTFEGLGNLAGRVPADPDIAVGEGYVFEVTEPYDQIFTTSGTAVTSPFEDNALWASFGGPCAQNETGDWSQVLFDQLADQWVVERQTHEAASAGPVSIECLAVSQTSNPTGAYYLYSVPVSNTQWGDYPQFGMWPNAYYLGINLYSNSDETSRTGDEIMALDRADMLTGQPVQVVQGAVGPQYETLVPVTLEGTTLPPNSNTAYFMAGPMDGESSGDVLLLWGFTPEFSDPSASPWNGPLEITVNPYNLDVCPTVPNCGVQPGTNVKLETWQDNLMLPVGYRNFGSYQSIVGTYDEAGGDNVAAIEWFEIRDPGVNAYAYQQGTYDPTGADRYEQSIAVDENGDMALAYTLSSSTIYPSLAYTGRLSTDPLGTMTQPEQILWPGSGSQTGYSRWGDASYLTLAPDGCTFWYVNAYMPATSSMGWSTAIGSFSFSGCT